MGRCTSRSVFLTGAPAQRRSPAWFSLPSAARNALCMGVVTARAAQCNTMITESRTTLRASGRLRARWRSIDSEQIRVHQLRRRLWQRTQHGAETRLLHGLLGAVSDDDALQLAEAHARGTAASCRKLVGVEDKAAKPPPNTRGNLHQPALGSLSSVVSRITRPLRRPSSTSPISDFVTVPFSILDKQSAMSRFGASQKSL